MSKSDLRLKKNRFGESYYGIRDKRGFLLTAEEAKNYFEQNNVTNDEMIELKSWIDKGNNFYDNPYFLYKENGNPCDFISAYRLIEEVSYEQLC